MNRRAGGGARLIFAKGNKMNWLIVLMAFGASFLSYKAGWYVGHTRGWNDCAGLMTCLPKTPKNRLKDQNWQLN